MPAENALDWRHVVKVAGARFDPLGWTPATVSAVGQAARRPARLGGAVARLAGAGAQVPVASLARALGLTVPPPVDVDDRDSRFTDPAWTENPCYWGIRQSYGAWCRFVDEVLDAGKRDSVDDLKVASALHLMTDALSPTNFLLTNPSALVRAFQTGGRSVVQGARLALDDLRQRNGLPAKVDTTAFTLGVDLAATPGSVVFRNDLIELIQYAPQTDQVYDVPLLLSPPWINKYYVMDLAPGRSLVQWAVEHGRTVFAISYRNPDESMRDVTMDDYFQQGVLTALDTVQDITGAAKVDLMALCLGGAMGAMTAAWLADAGDDRLGTLTLLNTMLDYTDPGELRAFVDRDTLERVEIRMQERGFLDAGDMALAFDLLRARDLVFRYLTDRWLMGREAPPFDILAWNADATRMPAAMHASYLRQLYGDNQLARGEFVLAGRTIDLSAITVDTYVVGAINDHIVPWQASYATTSLVSGDVRYVLSSGGHIAGVVNPPSAKAWHEIGGDTAAVPETWRASGDRVQGSWWEDWAAWSAERAGSLVDAPSGPGTPTHPVLGDAPGTYVRT